MKNAFILSGILAFVYLIKKFMETGIDITDSTLKLIAKEEGVRYSSYKDIAGFDTIGVGHKILPDEKHLLTKKLNDSEVNDILRKDLYIARDSVKKNVKVKLSQSQFNALVSLVFNIGIGAFKTSTVLRKINEGASETAIVVAWLMWNKAGGKVSKPLYERRRREAEIFINKQIPKHI